MLEIIKGCIQQPQYFYRALILAVLLYISYLYYKEHRDDIVQRLILSFHDKWKSVFFFYLSFILVSTLFARKITNPFLRVWDHFGFRNDISWNMQIFGNVILFIPYIFFYIIAFKPSKPKLSSFLLSVVTTLFIELSQLLFWLGSFQFADIVHNIVGGMLGCVVWYLVNFFKTKQIFSRAWTLLRKKIDGALKGK